MALTLSGLLSRKNLNMIAGLFALLVALWLVMYAVPSLFYNLFDTTLGNLLLLVFVGMAAMYSANLGIGLGAVFVILWRFSHMG